ARLPAGGRMTTLLLSSHGTSDPGGRRAVAGLVSAVAEAAATPVAAAFVDVEQPDVPTALDRLVADGATPVVVPLLLSAGYHVHVDLTEATDAFPTARLTGALGPDPRLGAGLVRRLPGAGLRGDGAGGVAPAGAAAARPVVA